MTNRNKVIVVGCHTGGFGVIRGLAGKGIHIVAMTYDKADYGYVSRNVSETVVIPHPLIEAERFIGVLLENARRWEGALILETDDNAAVTLSKNKEALSKYYRVATAEWEIVKQFVVKKEAHRVARESGVPHPGNWSPGTLGELDEVMASVQYPCMLKPVNGHEFFHQFRVKNFEVNNADELRGKFALCMDCRQEVMVQEIVPGPERDLYKMVTYVNSVGEISARFFWNKLRQHPPMFGVARVGVSQPRNEEVEALAERLLRQSRYKGFCSIELKKDPRDNQFKLMEVNVRMPRNIMISVASGVNFPLIIYQDLVEGRQVKVTDYTENVYWIELWPDVYNMLFQRKKEGFTLREYVGPYLAKNKVFAEFTTSDMRPFMKLSSHMVSKSIERTGIAKLVRQLSRSRRDKCATT